MPTSKSAMKRVITSEKRRLRHKSRRSDLTTAEKKFRAAVTAKDLANVVALCSDVCSKLDKAAKSGTIHANKASRKKSQLMSLANTVKA